MPIVGEYAPSPFDFSRNQVDQYESSNGTEGTTLLGRPVVIVTTIGAKTGKVRKIPLMRIEHEGQYAVVASLGGAPKNPVWYYNIKANPLVVLQDGAAKQDYLAREITGEERAQWWERAVATYAPFVEYEAKTDRVIPIFVLTPTG